MDAPDKKALLTEHRTLAAREGQLLAEDQKVTSRLKDLRAELARVQDRLGTVETLLLADGDHKKNGGTFR